MPKIVTVWAPKGGVGKTTLAYALGGVLVDLEWDDGGARVQWGCASPSHPSGSDFYAGCAPASHPGRCTLSADPTWCPATPTSKTPYPPRAAGGAAGQVGGGLAAPVHGDRHPSRQWPRGQGALAVADLVVVPAVLRTKELNALAGAVVEYHDFPLLVMPNPVPPVPPAKELARLTAIVRAAGVPVGPPIRHHPWWARRQIPAAISAYPPDAVPASAAEAWQQLHRLAQEVQRHAR